MTTVIVAEWGREARDMRSGSRRQAETCVADAPARSAASGGVRGQRTGAGGWSGDPADHESLMTWKAALQE